MRNLPRRALIAILSAGVLGSSALAPGEELRGLWVVRTALTSSDSIDRTLSQAARAGFGALFVQVRGRGDAFYASRLVPRSPLLARQPVDYDPLALCLTRGRERGLKVHAWVNVLLAAPFDGVPRAAAGPQHVLVQHPEWFMVPRGAARSALGATGEGWRRVVREAARADSDVEGYYLSPSAPGVQAHLEEVVRELVSSYDLDGLHFDFIRYPGPTYDHSHWALQAFQRERAGRELFAAPAQEPAAWSQFLRERLTALAERLARAARERRPRIVISAAVVPDEATAVQHRFQDWPLWLERGILDALCPMTYTAAGGQYRQQVQRARSLAQGQRALWPGIGAFRLSFDGIAEKVALAREAGANGFVFFSHESLVGLDLTRLRDEVVSVRPRTVNGSAGAGDAPRRP